MTAPRIVVAGATTAITRRTTLRKAFLAPWHPLVDDCFLYALADAQRATEVDVHHSVRVVNHHHTTVTPKHDNLPEFLRRLHRDVSCALDVLLAQHRYDIPHEIFDDRQAHQMRLLDAEAQASHLVYEYLNPTAAGLVLRPEHMPGRTLDFNLWKVGSIEVRRPPVYFDKKRPDTLRLTLTPPPLLYLAFDGDMDRLVYHMNKLANDGWRAIRDARKGRPVVGARRLERLHPWSEPRTAREPGGERVPTFRVGARGIVGRTRRIHAALEVREFRRNHREVRKARRDGDPSRSYPFGTYAASKYHGAPVESEPPAHAVVARPGPLLSDVKAQLAARTNERDERIATSFELVDRVRDALREEAADIVEDADLDLSDPKPVGGSTSADNDPRDPDADELRPLVVVRHRFDPPSTTVARRVITLRDRRRTRPRRNSCTHGADPPS